MADREARKASLLGAPTSASAPPSHLLPQTSVFAPFDCPDYEYDGEIKSQLDGAWLDPSTKQARNRSQTTTPIAMHAQAHQLGDNVLTATQSSPARPRHGRTDAGPAALDLDEAERRLLEHQEKQSAGQSTPALSTSSSASIPSIDSCGELSLQVETQLESPTPATRKTADSLQSTSSSTTMPTKHGLYRHPFARLAADGDAFTASPSSSTSGSLSSSPFSTGDTSGSPGSASRQRSLTDRAMLATPDGEQPVSSTTTATASNFWSALAGSRPSRKSPGHQHQSSKSLSHIGQLRLGPGVFTSSQAFYAESDIVSSPTLLALGQHSPFHLGTPSSDEQGGQATQLSEIGTTRLEADGSQPSFDLDGGVPTSGHTTLAQHGLPSMLADKGLSEETLMDSDAACGNSSSTLVMESSAVLGEQLTKLRAVEHQGTQQVHALGMGTPGHGPSPPRTGVKPRPPPLFLTPQSVDPALQGGGLATRPPFAAGSLLSPFSVGAMPTGRAQSTEATSSIMSGVPAAVTTATQPHPGWPHLPQSAYNDPAQVHTSRTFSQPLPSRPTLVPSPFDCFAQQHVRGPLPGVAHHHSSLESSSSHSSKYHTGLAPAFAGPRSAGLPMTTPATPIEPHPGMAWPFGVGGHGGNVHGMGMVDQMLGGVSSSVGSLMPGPAAESTRMNQMAAQLQARDSTVDYLQKHIDRLSAQLASLSAASGGDAHGGGLNVAGTRGEGPALSPTTMFDTRPPSTNGEQVPATEVAHVGTGAFTSTPIHRLSLSDGTEARRGSSPTRPTFGFNAAAAPFYISPSASSSSLGSASSGLIGTGMVAPASDSGSDSYQARSTTEQYIGPKVLVERALGPRNQEATIVLQQQLKSASPEHKQAIISAIAVHALPLAFDKHGNFLLQRAISTCPQLAWQLKGSFVQLSLSPYGCHVVQKILDEGEEYRTAVVQEMLGTRLAETLTSRNSIHVWQKLLEINWSSAQFRKSIFRKINDTMRGTWARTAVQETGSIICQNIFESADAEDRQECIGEILVKLRECAMDQYGVWVAQHLVEHGDPDHRRAAMDKLLEDAVGLTLSQYGQKAIMSALRTNDEIFVRRYVDILCGQESAGGSSTRRSVIVEIGATPQGLQIVTQLLTSVSPSQREMIIQTVRRNSVFLKGSKTGLKVHQLCERARAFTGY